MRFASFASLRCAILLGFVGVGCTAFSGSDSPASTGDGGGTGDGGVGACRLGTSAETLVTLSTPIIRLVASGQYVAWVEGKDLKRLSLSDCHVDRIANGDIAALAMDSKWIVWGDPTYKAVQQLAITQAPSTNGATVEPSILLDNEAFWISGTDPLISNCQTPCMNTSVEVQIGSPRLFALNRTLLFVFGINTGGPTGTALYTHLRSSNNTNLLAGPIAEEPDPLVLAANSTNVYWANTAGQLGGVPVAGGAHLTMPSVPGLVVLAVDETDVYVATSTTIGRIAGSGGTMTPLTSAEKGVTALALTPDAIIWASGDGIRRMSK